MQIFLLLIIFVSSVGIGIAYASPYSLDVDEHVYDIHYSVDAQILAMEIDQELNSLLIGLDNTRDSIFSIHLPDEMISAENDQFVVLVDWLESDYEIIELQYIREPDVPVTVIEFFVPDGTIEVEIIGTHTIPEFPLGVFTIFAVIIFATIMASRRHSVFRL